MCSRVSQQSEIRCVRIVLAAQTYIFIVKPPTAQGVVEQRFLMTEVMSA